MDALQTQFFSQLISRTKNFGSITWLGHPIWQNVLDLWTIQETLAEVRPELLIECGTNRGGSSLFYAHLFDLLGQGRVVTVDVKKLHDLQHPRITYLIGSSTAPPIVEQIRNMAAACSGPVLVILDSDHSCSHVLRELECYAPLVTPGSYCLVQDGVIDLLREFSAARPGPLAAIEQFMAGNNDFEVDDRRSERFLITHHPRGWLRRKTGNKAEVPVHQVDEQVSRRRASKSMLLITAADAAFFDLAQGCIRSIRDKPEGQACPVAFLDLGCTEEQLAWLRTQVDFIRRPDWEYAFPARDEAPGYYRGLLCRPFFRRYFPAYEVYFWIDADAWVQDWRAVELFAQGARKQRGLAIVPEIDRASKLEYGYQPRWRDRVHSWYLAALGKQIADEFYSFPLLNAGIFALHRDAPHWQVWETTLGEALVRNCGLLTDQMALNYAVYGKGLLGHTELLPAWCNWACHMGMPRWDSARGRLVEPYLPQTPIGILHLTVKKHVTRKVHTTDGQEIDLRVRYPAGPVSSAEAAPAADTELPGPERSSQRPPPPHLTGASEVEQTARRAAQLQPNNAAVQNNLGTVLARQGKLDEAEACFRDAITLDPAFVPAHSNLGNLLRLQGKLDEAVASCREALRLRPDFADARRNLEAAIQEQQRRGPQAMDQPSETDYISPGLVIVHPDACFPNMIVGDRSRCRWRYLRREIPHQWYVDRRYPLIGFANRDEAHILHNTALRFRGRRALEIGCWLGWSACHLALGGVSLDVIDPVLERPEFLESVTASLTAAGVISAVHLVAGPSPEKVHELAGGGKRQWDLFFIDGDHDGTHPLEDTMACEPYASEDALMLFHDLTSPFVGQGLDYLRQRGWHTMVYQTMQIMGVAWRGKVQPVEHIPDPKVRWSLPAHLDSYLVSGLFQ